MTTRKPIKRITKHFQLRLEHPQDAHVKEVLDYARSQRREVTVIRDAVELFYALEQGDLDALYAKFPQFKSAVGGGGGGGQIDEDKLADRIAEKVVMLGGSKYSMESAVQLPLPLPAPSTGKTLGGFKALVTPAEADDDLPTIAISKSKNDSSALNFVTALKSMQF